MLSAKTLAFLLLSAHGVISHPLFPGKVVSRTGDLLAEYDYVVIGAGASGLTVANRLSEDPAITILVVEAGEFDVDEDFMTIPGLAGGAVGTKYDWNISYTAEEPMNGRAISVPLGKVVGGSTKLNRMVFDRGARSDYDGWEALGNEGWNHEALLPYFKKNENFTPPSAEILAEYDVRWDLEYHGDQGYMQSSYSPFFWPTTKNLVNATTELGINIPDDQAMGYAIGGYYCPHNQDPVNVTRSSAEEAYYASASQRPNFHLLDQQQVTRILADGANGTVRATGVEYAASSSADRQTVSAKKEVILAAGSLHSPQLLQVSGIGDPDLLASIGVDTVVDLPSVGHNLHDHVSLAVVNTINANFTAGNLQQNTTFAAEARAQYDSERRGPLSTPTGDFLLFLPLSTYSNATDTLHSSALSGNASASLPAGTPTEVAVGYQASYESLTQKLIADDAAFLEIIWADGVVVLGLQHPFSRGTVKAASANIFDAPLADAGFLRNPLDLALLREGVRFARRLVATDAIATLEPVEVAPGSNVTSDADLDGYIRGSATTLYHPAGSCKMGPRDEGGVVDAQLKVYGIEGLSIVDASVIPMLPAAHTMTTVYAVAERAADIIKDACKI